MNWKTLFYSKGIKPHIVHPDCVDGVIDDIESRYGVTPNDSQDSGPLALDPGGMAFINPRTVRTEIDGLGVQCSSEHILALQCGLSSRDLGNGMTKVYFNWNCAVVPTIFFDDMVTWISDLDDQGDWDEMLSRVEGFVATPQ
jgi:hypothetical protein